MEYDVIVAGGGPAGATAAKYLAQSGLAVLLLQKDFSYKKPCGGGLREDAFAEFELSRDAITHIVTNITIESTKECIEFDISNMPLAIVDRVAFDSSLRADAKKCGARVLEAKVVGLQTSKKNVVVSAKAGSERLEFEAKYLIAADGVNSTIRSLMRNEHPSRVLTNYCDIDTKATHKCRFFFNSTFAKGAYAWSFPYKGGLDIGSVQVDANKKSIHSLLAFLQIKEQPKIKGFFIPQWQSTTLYEKRVFYVGDSAQQVLPFTYEGIYYAIKSAKLLATVIAKGADPSEYEKEWNKTFYKKFATLQKLQQLFLKNEFTIAIMMKILKNPKVKQRLLDLWMDRYQPKLNWHFYLRLLKRVVFK